MLGKEQVWKMVFSQVLPTGGQNAFPWTAVKGKTEISLHSPRVSDHLFPLSAPGLPSPTLPVMKTAVNEIL
jgi:hypothetical protein